MGWHIRIDRFSDTHLCFSQKDTDSCGLASSKMIVFKVNKLQPGKSALTTEKHVEKIYKKYDSTAVNVGKEGVFFHRMHLVLNELDIGTWAHAAPAQAKIPENILGKMGSDVLGMGAIANALNRGDPIMLKIDWGGASHAVVLDTVNKLPMIDQYWLSICDPADGDVHITSMNKNQPISYLGASPSLSINFGSDPKHGYKGKPSTGVITEMVYRVS